MRGVMCKRDMEADWEEKLLRAANRETEEQERLFLGLVDQASGHIDAHTAKVLLGTFTAKPDFGTQERVESVLATGDKKVVLKAVLEEMPRLVSEAPEWAASLLGQELEHRTELLLSNLPNMSSEVQSAISRVAQNEEFSSFYPNAELLAQ